MANYAHLKVFKDFYQLTLTIIATIREFPKMYKYTLGSAIQNNIYLILQNIVLSNSTIAAKRSVILLETITQVELLQIQIRLCKDLNCMPGNKAYYKISGELTSILKQLEGWYKLFRIYYSR